MAATKLSAGKSTFRIPYIFAAVFKLYSSNTSEHTPSTKAQYLSVLEMPMETPHGFRPDVTVTSPLKLGTFLERISAAECNGLFWAEKGKQ